ncbi:hypothetical protein [Euzebya rosea]|uniref:hypothetical protein n=1 Tax=Euzebya rosea TaxID=2052804 RepID=UPI000D3ED7B7|nr:hypothetical protein [Euzebya rosea]
MNNTLRTESINRTVAVVVKHALDVEHAVDVLLAEFGFDRVFTALSLITTDTKAHRAMWIALATETFKDADALEDAGDS